MTTLDAGSHQATLCRGSQQKPAEELSSIGYVKVCEIPNVQLMGARTTNTSEVAHERTQGFAADPDYWKGEVLAYVGLFQNLKDLKDGSRTMRQISCG